MLDHAKRFRDLKNIGPAVRNRRCGLNRGSPSLLCSALMQAPSKACGPLGSSSRSEFGIVLKQVKASSESMGCVGRAANDC